jgi:hypothetical protein
LGIWLSGFTGLTQEVSRKGAKNAVTPARRIIARNVDFRKNALMELGIGDWEFGFCQAL